MKRTLLARSASVASRQRVYRIADGLEIDEAESFDVHRTRVFFEDVILITYRRYRGWAFLITVGVVAVLCVIMAWGIWLNSKMAGLLVAGTTALPLFIVIALRAALGVDEVNVYGRRTRARMRFAFRKGRAREVMDEIIAAVRARQSAS